MEYKPKRKRIVYTDPLDQLKAIEKIIYEGTSTRIIAEELSVSLTNVQQWVKKYKDFGPTFFTDKKKEEKSGVWINSEELARLKQIEKEYDEKQLQVEILKKFQTFLNMK